MNIEYTGTGASASKLTHFPPKNFFLCHSFCTWKSEQQRDVLENRILV